MFCFFLKKGTATHYVRPKRAIFKILSYYSLHSLDYNLNYSKRWKQVGFLINPPKHTYSKLHNIQDTTMITRSIHKQPSETKILYCTLYFEWLPSDIIQLSNLFPLFRNQYLSLAVHKITISLRFITTHKLTEEQVLKFEWDEVSSIDYIPWKSPLDKLNFKFKRFFLILLQN